MKKVLILGARGYLGSFLLKYAPNDIELIISARDKTNIPDGYSFVSIDIFQKDDVIKKITEVKPDVIINCIANSLPDVAEQKKEWTYAVNVEGVSYIVEACKQSGAKLIHLSTDYVFSGENGNYQENDERKPINYYGLTKKQAEDVVIESNIEYLICRTSVLYGLKLPYQRKVLFYSFYEKLIKNKEIVAAPQIGSPTLVDDLAMCLYKMIGFKKSGIYHTAYSKPVSRYDYAMDLVEVFGFDKNLVILGKDIERKAPRPKNSSLITEKLQKDFDISFRSPKEAFEFIKKELGKKMP